MGLFSTDDMKKKGKDEVTNLGGKANDEIDRLSHNDTEQDIDTNTEQTNQMSDELDYE